MVNDTCTDGTCGGAPRSCAGAADQCNAGVCNESTNHCEPEPKADGTTCNDGNSCTQADSCQSGVCVGANPVVCTAPDDCHFAGTCDPSTGTCSHPLKANGTVCSDGDACTQTDTCHAGVCSGTKPVVCTPSDQCHDAGICNPTTGTCSNPSRHDGTACTDGNACTQADACQAGVCTGTNPVVCTASDQCHQAGICDPATGTCSNPNEPDGLACNDGLFCTVDDTCSAGVCGGAARDCSALADQCTDGTCDEFAHQCEATPKTDGTACSDGSLCTQNDACQAGVCAGSPLVCDDANPCTTDSCDPTAGC